MLATGWTLDELRRTPAVVVRRVIWRLFAVGLWNDDLAKTAAQPVGHLSAYASTSAWADAQRARTQAKSIVDELSAVLWPEDDDG